MRILHTSDLHLGFYLNGISYNTVQDLLKDEILRIATEQNVDVIVIAGDVFDRAVTQEESVAVYDRLITTLSLHYPLCIIAGNHDSAVRLGVLEGVLSGTGVQISGRLSHTVRSALYGDTRVHMLPYFTVDEVRYLYDDLSIDSYNGAMKRVVEGIKDGFIAGERNILVTHCYVSNSVVSESDGAVRVMGNSQQVEASIFSGFDYVAAGHLHRAQRIGENVYYSGSPLPYAFSESGVKTVNIYDSDTGKVTKHTINTPLKLIELEDSFESILSRPEIDQTAYTKITVTDRYITPELMDKLRELYPNLLMVAGKAFGFAETDSKLSIDETSINSMTKLEIIQSFLKDYTEIELDHDLEQLLEELLQQTLDI